MGRGEGRGEGSREKGGKEQYSGCHLGIMETGLGSVKSIHSHQVSVIGDIVFSKYISNVLLVMLPM